MFRATVASLLILATPAAAQPLVDQPPDPVASAAAEAVFAEQVQEARAVGAYTAVSGWPVDLDGDGATEIVGVIGSAFICGGFACVFVLRPTGGGDYETVFFDTSSDAPEVLESRTRGWRDIAVWRPDVVGGASVLRWNGTGYAP